MKVNIENVEIKNLKINQDCYTPIEESSPLNLVMNSKLLDDVRSKINNPNSINKITEDLEIPSILINYHLASKINLSSLKIKGISNMIHLPTTISTNDKGRSSIYKLKKGETVLAGIYINSKGILLKYISRETGNSELVKIGDKYKYTLKDLNGNLYFEGIGKLETFNDKKGEGSINFSQTETKQLAKPKRYIKHICYVWSMYEATVIIEF